MVSDDSRVDWRLTIAVVAAAVGVCFLAPLANPVIDSGLLRRGALPLFVIWGAYVILQYFRTKDSGKLARQSGALVLAALAVQAIPFFATVIEVIRYPYDLEWEGYAYKAGWLLAHNRPIYHAWQNPVGGIDSVYPPAFYITLAALMKIFPPGLYLFRSMIFACGTAMTLLTWRVIHRATGSWMASLAGALFPLAAATSHYYITGSINVLGLLFSMAAFTVAYEDLRSLGELRRRALIVGLFLAATLTKQSFLAGPAAVFLLLFIQRRWRLAMEFAVLYGVPLVAITAILTWLTDGRYFFLTYGWQKYATYDWHVWPAVASEVCRPLLVFLVPVAAYFWQQRRNAESQLLALYLILAFLTTFSAVHIGAGVSYFLEPAALLGLAFGLTVYSLKTGRLAGPRLNAILTIAGAVWICFCLRAYTRPLDAPLAAHQRAGDAVLRVMSRIHGPMLSQDPYLILLAGQPENTLEWYASTMLAPLAKPQANAFLNDLAQRKYAGIVIYRTWWEYHLKSKDFIWTRLLAEPGRIVQQHYRDLRRDEFLPDELPAYREYVVLVPCLEGCGVSTTILPAEPAQSASYGQLWRWIRNWRPFS